MSLIDVAAELEYVPEQELINLSRNPQSRFPQFLVLSEVQRRNQMRRMYENQVNKAEQPLTTVAEEKVMELAQSSAMPNIPSPMSNETSQSPKGLLGMASEPVPVMMSSGGDTESFEPQYVIYGTNPAFRTPEAVMRQSGDELKRLRTADRDLNARFEQLKKLYMAGLIDTDRYVKSIKTLTDTIGQDADVGRFRPFYGAEPPNIPTTKKGLEAALQQSRNEMQQRQLGLASGGLVSLQNGGTTSLEESFENPYLATVLGNLMRNNLALSTAIEANEAIDDISQSIEESETTPRQIGGGLLALAGLLPFTKRIKTLGSGAKNIYEKTIKPFVKKRYGATPAGPAQTVPTGLGQPFTVRGTTYNPSQVTISGTPSVSALRNTLRTPEGKFLSAAVPIGTGTYLMSSDASEDIGTGDTGGIGDTGDTGTGGTGETGETQTAQTMTGLQQMFSPLDLARFGFTILGSKSPSELGINLSNLVSEKQRSIQEGGLSQAQTEYYKAQVSEIRDRIKDRPSESLREDLAKVQAAIKDALEDPLNNAELLGNLSVLQQALFAELAEMRGIKLDATGNLAGGATVN